MRALDRKILSLLGRAGALSPDALEGAASQATREGKSVAAVLAETGAIRPAEILGHLACHTRIAAVHLPVPPAPREILDLLPASLARAIPAVPLARIGSFLTLAVVDPFDLPSLDEVRRVTGLEPRPVLATEKEILRALQGEKPEEDPGDGSAPHGAAPGLDVLEEGKPADMTWIVGYEDENEEDEGAVDVEADRNSPVVGVVQRILQQAVQDRASDVHLEPHTGGVRIRFRVDGLMRGEGNLPRSIHRALVSRIKVLARLDIAERRRPQDGKFQGRFGTHTVDFRVSVLPVIHGEKVVLRVLDANERPLDLLRLGFEGRALEALQGALHEPHGMILITGPTGSGKSTTLYSAVMSLGAAERNIVTVEDPVEFALEGVNQVQVNPKAGMTFASALRAILRQDPDVVLVGEIRDSETLEVGVKAALTGHLVLSTLHTNDAASAVMRMVDMGVDPFLVASSLRLVAAQRLARQLCAHCRTEVTIPEDVARAIGLPEGVRGPFWHPRGCAACHGGYRGRIAILEVLPISDAIRRAVSAGATDDKIRDIGREEGMATLRQAALQAATRGDLTLEEALRLAPPDPNQAGQWARQGPALGEPVQPEPRVPLPPVPEEESCEDLEPAPIGLPGLAVERRIEPPAGHGEELAGSEDPLGNGEGTLAARREP